MLGYNVVFLSAITTDAGEEQGGVGLVVRENGWSVNFTQFHGSNVVSCEVVTSGKRTPIIGAYLPPSAMDHLTDLGEDLA